MLIRRRHYKVGPMFDAAVGIDLTKPHQVQELWRYIRGCNGAMAPPCIGWKGLSALSRVIAPD
eukprot:291157-Prorocentrum_lima.AAC.1